MSAPNGATKRFTGLVSRHPVGTFLFMAYALGWSTLFVANYLGLPFLLSSSLLTLVGLALPAFLVTAAVSGARGVRDLLSRCLRWRVGIGWYLLAFPGLLLATLLVASVFLGGTPLEALARKWPLFFTVFLPALLIPFVLTQLAEEAGWAGFMQDTLQERHGPLRASLMVAPAFALFHLPFPFLEAPRVTLTLVPVALVQMVVLGIVALFFRPLLTWLYNGSGRSVPIVAFFHSAYNSAGSGSGYATRFVRELVPFPAVLLVSTAVVVVLAVVIVLLTGGRLDYEPERASDRPRVH